MRFAGFVRCLQRSLTSYRAAFLDQEGGEAESQDGDHHLVVDDL